MSKKQLGSRDERATRNRWWYNYSEIQGAAQKKYPLKISGKYFPND